jgi:16S rRNA processing protein RimM
MRLLVGRIGRAHGIHGEATIEVRTDEPDKRFAIGAKVLTDARCELTISSNRNHNGILLLGFESVIDRKGIDELRDTLMYSEIDIDAPGVDDDDFHVLQLIGCTAFLESGEKFGDVSDVINLPGQDLLAIATASGEVFIPFVHQLVPVVDVKNRRMTVIPPQIGEIGK